jgi:hypothetical protein
MQIIPDVPLTTTMLSITNPGTYAAQGLCVDKGNRSVPEALVSSITIKTNNTSGRMTTHTKSLLFFAGVFVLVGAMCAQAVPIPAGPALAESGDGLNSRWVQVDAAFKPDNIAEAKATLAKAPGDPGFITAINQQVSEINFSDFGEPGTSPVPAMAGADPRFAVEYSGFLNVVNPGTYSLRAHHDDGFELSLGGEVVSQFDANTAPIFTTVNVDLAPGLYGLSFIGWEQGGLFVNRLLWMQPEESEFSVIPQRVLFANSPQRSVPDSTSSAVLLLLACFGLFAGRFCLPAKA